MDSAIPSCSWDSGGERNSQQDPKNTNEQQLFLHTRNGNIWRAEEGYYKEKTQSDRSLTLKATMPAWTEEEKVSCVVLHVL